MSIRAETSKYAIKTIILLGLSSDIWAVGVFLFLCLYGFNRPPLANIDPSLLIMFYTFGVIFIARLTQWFCYPVEKYLTPVSQQEHILSDDSIPSLRDILSVCLLIALRDAAFALSIFAIMSPIGRFDLTTLLHRSGLPSLEQSISLAVMVLVFKHWEQNVIPSKRWTKATTKSSIAARLLCQTGISAGVLSFSYLLMEFRGLADGDRSKADILLFIFSFASLVGSSAVLVGLLPMRRNDVII